jgi:hypothetical protein
LPQNLKKDVLWLWVRKRRSPRRSRVKRNKKRKKLDFDKEERYDQNQDSLKEFKNKSCNSNNKMSISLTRLKRSKL